MIVMNEELLFQSRSPRLAALVGMQHYDADTDRYYSVTRVEESDGIYSMYGIPLDIPELADDSE